VNCGLCHSCAIAGMRDGTWFCGARWWQLLGSEQGAAEDKQRERNQRQIRELEQLLAER